VPGNGGEVFLALFLLGFTPYFQRCHVIPLVSSVCPSRVSLTAPERTSL